MNLRSLFLVLSLIFISCTQDPIVRVEPLEPAKVDTTEVIVNQFIDLATTDGVYVPVKFRGPIKVYLDTSINEVDSQIIYDLANKIVQEVGKEFISFEYTNDINDYHIGMVYGGPEYGNSVFGNVFNTDTDWWGAVTGGNNCTDMRVRYGWYNRHNPTLIKHEFLHAIGLGHASSGNSIMYHNITDASTDITFEDISVIKLLYYKGVYGEMVPPLENPDDCSYDYRHLSEDELGELKDFIRLIVDNDYF